MHRRPDERGAAVADFALVSGLLALFFMAVVQLGLALHIRNTLVSCAAEGARYGARLGSSPSAGAQRARELISRAVTARYAQAVTADVESVNGVRVVVVRVAAPLPVIGPLGPDRRLDVVGRAFLESQ